MTPPNKIQLDKYQFLKDVKECKSIRDLCKKYKKPINGYYALFFKKWIDEFECDVSHFYDEKKNTKINKNCQECGKEFSVSLSEKKRKFCSLLCANQKVRGKALPRMEDDLIWNRKHRVICFRYHKKECVVCGERIAVSVHHVNEDHNDDRPENLVPICSNHHIYLHSLEGRPLVIDIVNKYVENFIRGAGVIG